MDTRFSLILQNSAFCLYAIFWYLVFAVHPGYLGVKQVFLVLLSGFLALICFWPGDFARFLNSANAVGHPLLGGAFY